MLLSESFPQLAELDIPRSILETPRRLQRSPNGTLHEDIQSVFRPMPVPCALERSPDEEELYWTTPDQLTYETECSCVTGTTDTYSWAEWNFWNFVGNFAENLTVAKKARTMTDPDVLGVYYRRLEAALDDMESRSRTRRRLGNNSVEELAAFSEGFLRDTLEIIQQRLRSPECRRHFGSTNPEDCVVVTLKFLPGLKESDYSSRGVRTDALLLSYGRRHSSGLLVEIPRDIADPVTVWMSRTSAKTKLVSMQHYSPRKADTSAVREVACSLWDPSARGELSDINQVFALARRLCTEPA